MVGEKQGSTGKNFKGKRFGRPGGWEDGIVLIVE